MITRTFSFRIKFLLCLVVFGFAILALPWAALHAQSADAIPSPDSVAIATAPLVERLATQYPLLTTILMLVGAVRAILKPLFSALEANASTAATARRIEESTWFRIVAWLLDYTVSVKVRALSSPARTLALFLAAGIGVALLGGTAGCAGAPRITATNVAPLVESAAYTGALTIVGRAPEKREVFVQAEAALSSLIASGTVTLPSLKASLDPLLQADIRELRDPRTALLVDGAVIIADAALGQYRLTEQQDAAVLAVAVAARNGIARANAITSPR